MNSLRIRLLLWVLVPMTVALGLIVGISWNSARDMAQLVQDRQLLASAQVMAEQVGWQDGVLRASTPPAALEIFASQARDSVYFQVRSADGRLLAGWPDLDAAAASGALPGYALARFRGEPVRVVTLTRTLYENGRPVPVLVSVAETRRAYHALVRALWWPTVLHESGLLALALVLMLLGLTLELRPLLRLRTELLARAEDDLAPLQAAELQRELRPVVETINQYAARLTRQVELQKRFIADAAHQLRTPVALIGTQLNYAGRLPASAELRDTLQALRSGARHLTQLINQLLSLSQAEAYRGGIEEPGPVDLATQARDAVVELAALADARGIDLGIAAAREPAMVLGHAPLVHAIVFNLVDNAIRYTPRDGSVTVRIDPADGRVVLRVEDTGPGIPAELRPRVFERFNRGSAAGVEGTGLGLAIVREAATACRATVDLRNRAEGGGLIVDVGFVPAPRAG